MTFQNQVILITGGSSGIGLATARAFAHEGARVWLLARNTGRLASALEEVQAASKHKPQGCGAVSADVADPDATARAVAEVTARAGPIDILVNSAGAARPGYFQDLDLAVFREMMEVNYFGALHVLKAVAPGMMQRRSGHIVNVSSGAAIVPTFGYTAYGASKYALRGLSDVLRLELKPYNVLISVVYPPD
ncbi:MAG: SDR family oxidoreductase, partial [Nitrososphaerales archaeon]